MKLIILGHKAKIAILCGIIVLLSISISFVLTLFSSKCVHEIKLNELVVMDLDFSPDGKYLAVGGYDINGNTVNNKNDSSGIRVYSVSDQVELLTFNTDDNFKNRNRENSNCAWNLDGSLLAVAHGWGDGNLRVWSMSERKIIESIDLPFAGAGSLCFDRHDNLYAATNIISDWDGKSFPASVWWNSKPRRREDIGTHLVYDAHSVSVVSIGSDTRLAISSYASPVEILRIHFGKDQQRVIKKEYSLPGTDTAWIQLSLNGKYLAVLEKNNFKLFRLFNDHADTIISIPSPSGYWGGRRWMFQPLDISQNGLLVAYSSKDKTKVIRVIDGETVFEINRRVNAVALSPDGTFLAAALPRSRKICIYKIP